MHSTWVLVADRVRARLFASTDDGASLMELEDFVNVNGRKPDRTNGHKLPRTQESSGSARHAIEPKSTAAEKTERRFARELNEILESGRVGHRYQHLIIAAPPRFLGAIRQSMGNNVQACVLAELDKDLCTMPMHVIKSQLADQLALSAKMANSV